MTTSCHSRNLLRPCGQQDDTGNTFPIETERGWYPVSDKNHHHIKDTSSVKHIHSEICLRDQVNPGLACGLVLHFCYSCERFAVVCCSDVTRGTVMTMRVVNHSSISNIWGKSQSIFPGDSLLTQFGETGWTQEFQNATRQRFDTSDIN